MAGRCDIPGRAPTECRPYNGGIFVHNSVVIFVEVCNNTSKLAPLFNPDGPKKVL